VGAFLVGGPVSPVLLEGLKILEYRGYDSAGLAITGSGSQGVRVVKAEGRIANLENRLGESAFDGDAADLRVGIGHTRWATHGPPSDANAHPHGGMGTRLALVHNGIIENYTDLKAELQSAGVTFRSDTDSEVLAHLIERALGQGDDLVRAVREVLVRLEGYYALAVLDRHGGRSQLVCARSGPPLALCSTPGGTYLASDVLALVAHSNRVSFLEDGDVARLEAGSFEVWDRDGHPVERLASTVEFNSADTDLGPWPHFMLKEIHEQPDVLARAAFGRISASGDDVEFEDERLGGDALASVQRVQVVACGTALHAGQIAAYLIEGLTGIPTDVDFASEFRYRQPCLVPDTLALCISQSGETADTLAAGRLAVEKGARLVSLCNVDGSSQVRESDGVVLTHAGPEIGVASTKAFTAQVVCAVLLAVRLGRARGSLSRESAAELLTELRYLRPKLGSLLTREYVDGVKRLARAHVEQDGFLFLGRGVNFPVALEGALKLKEISYMHAEGYAAGEMKHGPIALIDSGMSVFVINAAGSLAPKVRANMEQVQARGGRVVCVGSDPESLAATEETLRVPETLEWLSPILNTIPLQLFAYHVARLRGCDIDKPRNLAKSVTVE
jgi:glucosamine--fructose-6-phosphate aminotransferase (isomerizing)